MASKHKQRHSSGASSAEMGELLEEIAKRIDRAKVLYEQYFMGIQKIAPMQLQLELERRIREMTRQHMPNSRTRYKFTMLSQRFASYNTYWKRTMRQIENGTYIKHVAKVGRDAIRNGKDVPDEILAKMPKRMRERIMRDREMAVKINERKIAGVESAKAAGKVLTNSRKNVHTLDESDLGDVDYDSIFSEMVGGEDLLAADVSVSKVQPQVNKAPARATTIEGPGEQKPPGAATKPASPAVSSVSRSAPPKLPPKSSRPTPPPSPPTRGAAPPPRVPLPPGLSENDSKKLYQRYVKARKLVGEKTEGVTYAKLMRSLSKQTPKSLNKHSNEGLSWNVEVKGEKVILKAKPKTKP